MADPMKGKIEPGSSEKECENLIGMGPHAGQPAPPSYADTFPQAKPGYEYPANNPYIATMPSNYGHPNQGPQCPQNYTVIVAQPGPIPANARVVKQSIEDIPDFLCFSVFACICCCWMIGIFAICASSKTRGAKQNGDYDAAKSSSRQALILSVTAMVFGIMISAVYTFLRFVYHITLF